MLQFLVACALLLQPDPYSAQITSKEHELDALRKQLQKHEGRLSAAMYTLTHATESEDEMMRFLSTLSFIVPPAERDPEIQAPDVKSVDEFKARIASFLNSTDDVVCATAAIFLGAIGDASYVPRLVEELSSTVVRGRQADRQICRGRAAVALGLLQARAHVDKLLLLLRSKNSYDRQGATMALGMLKAKEHAKEVAFLLKRLHPSPPNKGEEFDPLLLDDDSAIVALVEMGVAADFSSEIAIILNNRFASEPRRSAMYALACIGASQYTEQIGALLDDEFEKGKAAIALGVLSAKEYVQPIALLLENESPLIRKDAALALALLNATETTGSIARLLTAKEEFVRYYAAVALTLLAPQKYSQQILEIVRPYHAKGYHLNKSDLHHLLSAEYEKFQARFHDRLKEIEGIRSK